MSPYQAQLESYGDQLRAKIASKFSASTFLAGSAATILTTLVTSFGGGQRLEVQTVLALCLATAASVLFVQAIIRLDELSMPKRFWPSRPDAQNRGEDVGLLTQDDLWALHDRMVYFWRRLTLTAAALTGAGLVALLVPPLPVPIGAPAVVRLACALLAAIAAALYIRRLDAHAPHNGSLIRPID